MSTATKELPKIPEPFLPANLEDLADDARIAPHEWTAQAMEELARQLTMANDFYYPLIGAAGMLRAR